MRPLADKKPAMTTVTVVPTDFEPQPWSFQLCFCISMIMCLYYATSDWCLTLKISSTAFNWTDHQQQEQRYRIRIDAKDDATSRV